MRIIEINGSNTPLISYVFVGSYLELPEDYDASVITDEDIIMDGALTVIDWLEDEE